MGYPEIFLSFFKLTQEVDAGPLLLQKPISCDPDETIHSLEKKIALASYQGGLILAKQLLNDGSFREISKLTSVGTTW